MARSLSALALLAALAAPGCGGGEPRVAVYPVSGTVTRDGKPLAGVSVQFHPTAVPVDQLNDDPALADRVVEADDQGKFSLSTYDPGDGVPAGDYVVMIRPPLGPGSEELDGPVPPKRVEPALAKYANQGTTPLKVTVKPGDNPPLAFDLK
ncbi:hypothetical protein TA3x_002166 [Tundrisphaera sp. TA3]|uniref:hypothetical protein n=1 Tax=Tundrisphaera sp. TA3 TaxID=3435775 RepID=UPI003EB9A277